MAKENEAELKEVMYYHLFQGEKHPLVITFLTNPDEDGILPVESVRGAYIPADHFQCEVLKTSFKRKEFNEFLKKQI